MKILEHTSTCLKLQRHPTLASGALSATLWIFGGILLSMGIIITQAMSVQTLSCQRVESTQVNCELIGSNVFQIPVKTTSITALQEATVKTDALGEAPAYSVVLYAQTDEIGFSNDNELASQQAIAQQINEFIQNSAATNITLQEDDRGLQGWVSAGFISVGLALIVLGIHLQKTATYTFDRSQNILTLNSRTLICNHTRIYSLDCLKRAYLLNNSEKASTISLELQNHSLKIVHVTNSLYTYPKDFQQQLVDLINQFTNTKKQ